MEYFLLFIFIIAIVFIIVVAGIMLAYPFIILKQRRFTKTDLFISIIMYSIIIIFILSILYDNQIIGSNVYFPSFGIITLLFLLSLLINSKVYKNRNKNVVEDGLFLKGNDLFILTNGIIPNNKDIILTEKIKEKCNKRLYKQNLGSIEKPSILLKNVVEPIINSNHMISNNPNIQFSHRMIYIKSKTESTFTFEDKDNWYLENKELNDTMINKLYDYVKWCTVFTPQDFSLTLSYDEGMKLYNSLIINYANKSPFPKFTDEDLKIAKEKGITDNYLEALKKLAPDFKYNYKSIISKKLNMDFANIDNPFGAALSYKLLVSDTLIRDKQLGPTCCIYIVFDTENKNNYKQIKTIEVYSKYGIAVITDLKNEKITFATVKNNQELLNTLINNLQ